MAVSAIAAVYREVSVQLRDGTGTPVTLTPPKRLASLVLDQSPGVYVWVKAQGVYVGRKKTEDALLTFTLRFVFTELTNASAGMVADFANFRGFYSANVSTTGPEFDGKSIDVVVTIDKTSGDKDDNANAVITYSDCFLVGQRVDENGDHLILELDYEALSYAVTGQTGS